MAEAAVNYSTIQIREKLRSQALKVWTVTLAITAVWVLIIVSPPLLMNSGFSAAPIYSFYSYICHQIPERSFHLFGHQFAVCSRCFGVYFGLLAGIATYSLWRPVDSIEPLPRFWLFLSMLPISIDWSLGVFGIWENNHASRFITGTILGVACAVFIMPALVEIVRNLTANDAFKRSAPNG
jgi:uncharacterized membrane protein